MDEVACLMDWDLEAIVRGCSSEAPITSSSTIMGGSGDSSYPNNNNNNNFSHYFCSEQDDEILWSFNDEFSETSKVLDELEELYKPFYPVLHPLSSQAILTTSLPILNQQPQEFKVLKAPQEVTLQDLKVPAATVSKCKRSNKKNKNKNVVKEVKAADGLCDSWAWRKYGQKPIKGSPYPRSYYKCSTSKGCLARKQVERSHLDPEVFLVTYTSDHSHPHPTRRNSLAGSTRMRNINNNKNNNNSIVASSSSSSSPKTSSSSSSLAAVLSPRTPLVKSIIENDDTSVVVQQSNNNKGLKKELVDYYELLNEDEGVDQLLGDGWFSITKLEELIGDLASNLEY